jgi:hypothetical protein
VDESDPDIAILRRQDGSFVAAFSARGATSREGIVEAARMVDTVQSALDWFYRPSTLPFTAFPILNIDYRSLGARNTVQVLGE